MMFFFTVYFFYCLQGIKRELMDNTNQAVHLSLNFQREAR